MVLHLSNTPSISELSFMKLENGIVTEIGNDIALVIFNDEIRFDNFTQKACLPKQSTSYPSPNQNAWAMGWVIGFGYLSVVFRT